MAGLSPAELLEKALNGESLDGDGTEQGDQGNNDGAAAGASNAVDAAGQGGQEQQQPQEQDKGGKEQTTDDEPAGAPIASKSGAYTIPYEKLGQARDRVKTLEGENATLRAQLEDLSARQQANLGKAEERAQDRADAGQAQTQADQNLDAAKTAIAQGVDIKVFGDFSEEAIAKGVGTLLQQAIGPLRDQLRAELREESAKTLKPIQERQVKEASNDHYSPIYQKHPDADEIVQSAEFDAWMKGQPSFTRSSIAAVMDPEKGGTAEQVIEVFDTFKAQTSKAAAPRAQGNGKPPEVERRVPHSLSEAAGEQHQDVSQQMLAAAGTNPNALLERMQGMTSEQIERVLNGI